jgi:ABC-type nitrate/sulfonate/bicarbonate transport system substrate-binding protein
VLVAGCSSSSGSKASGSSPAVGPLTNVTVATGSRSDSALIYVAQAAGYFRDEGINAKLVDISQVSNTSDALAAFYGGTYNFINNGASTTIASDAASGGHSVTAVMQMDVGTTQEIAIDSTKAKSLNLPSGNSPAASLAQLMALKGSHLTLAVTTLSSISAVDLLAACKAHGLTCAANSSSADIDLVTAGEPTTQEAGLQAHKFDAIAAGPPTTRLPNTVQIELGEISPVQQSVNDYLLVTPNYLSAHKDIVTKVVTAVGKAWKLYQSDPTMAEKDAAQMYKDADVTDPAEAHELFTGWAKYWVNPVPTSQAYSDTVSVMNLTGSKPVSLPYAQFADTSFATAAVSSLGIKSSG